MVDLDFPPVAFPRAVITAQIRNLEPQVASHLVKLLCVRTDAATQRHWRAELLAWLGRLAAMKVKATGRGIGRAALWRLLWEEPFEPDGTAYVAGIMRALAYGGYALAEASPEQVNERARDAYGRLIDAVAEGGDVAAVLDALPPPPAPLP